MLQAQGQRQFSRDPRRCVFTTTYFPKCPGPLPFPTPNHTSVKCLSFHGPDVSPGRRMWLLEAVGTPHLEGWALLGRWPWGTRLERGRGCSRCPGYLPHRGPGLSAILLGMVSSPPLHSHGVVVLPETPPHVVSQGGCQQDRQSGYLKSYFLAWEE